ncbi:hypothetical protein JOE65_000400 [Arthrobacter roseus]|nr:hypothetical protein [Arthrobacter roseus]
MYGWIFTHLPGPLWARIMISILLIATVILLLLTIVFPWLSQFNPLTDSTIGTS